MFFYHEKNFFDNCYILLDEWDSPDWSIFNIKKKYFFTSLNFWSMYFILAVPLQVIFLLLNYFCYACSFILDFWYFPHIYYIYIRIYLSIPTTCEWFRVMIIHISSFPIKFFKNPWCIFSWYTVHDLPSVVYLQLLYKNHIYICFILLFINIYKYIIKLSIFIILTKFHNQSQGQIK